MLTRILSPAAQRLSIAQVRIFRLSFGTAVSLWFSQLVGSDTSFVAAVLTMSLLGLPLPAPTLKSGVSFVLVFSGSLYAGLLLLPTLINQPMVGIILLVLALFWSFYYTTTGGSAVVGVFITVGIALATAVGSVDIDATLALVRSMSIISVFGILFVYVAHAVLPDSLADVPEAPPPKPAVKPEPPDLDAARWSAFRSLLIVLPIAILFLLSAASTAYVPVMIKVASMGQQAATDATKSAGKSLINSTLIGGAAAIVGWQMLSITPSLPVFVIFVALVGLVMGARIFMGPAMHPQGATWSYAYLTMLVILTPAVLDSSGGDAANIKFWQRLAMFGGTAAYAVIAVYVVDAFKPQKN